MANQHGPNYKGRTTQSPVYWGYAHAFIGGLYDGYFPYSTLKLNGNFGLGAHTSWMANYWSWTAKYINTAHWQNVRSEEHALTPYAVVNFVEIDYLDSLQSTFLKLQVLGTMILRRTGAKN